MFERYNVPGMASGEQHPPLKMEISLLQALCAAGWASLPRRLQARLRRYSWRNPHHQIVFEALQQLPTGPDERTHEHLQAALVRLGFPDVAFEIGAPGGHLSDEEIEHMMQEMESPPQVPAKAIH
jgi:hypothetical protein